MINQKIYGNQYDEIPGDLILDNDGGFIIGANRDNTNFVSKNFWSHSYIIKTDSIGNVEWEFLLSPFNHIQDIARGLVKSTDGGLVVATSRGFEYMVNSVSGQLRWESAYFFKLDENQNVVWDLEVFDSIRPGPSQGIKRLVAVDNGNAYVAAGDYNMIRSLNPPDGGTFGWLIKFSDDGILKWIRKYNIAESVGHQHEFYDLKSTSDGGLILAGSAAGAAPPGEPPSQAWLLKLDSFGCLIPGCQWQDTVTVTEQPGKAAAELAIYPNPTSDYLNFQLRSPQAIPQATFRILDAAGRVVKEFQSEHPGDTVIVPVWDWAPGLYFLEASAQGRVLKVEKFVVMK